MTPLAPPSPEDPTPDAALEALAAGELSPEAAPALEARIASEPALRAAYEDVLRVEAALRAEPLLPAPVGLEHRILRMVRERAATPTPARVLLRVAAAILVVLGSWFAFSNETSALADVRDTPAILERARDAVPTNLVPALVDRTGPAAAEATRHAPAMLLLVLGVALFVGGVAFLLHLHRSPARGGAS